MDKVYNIAVVEDSDESYGVLREYFASYSVEIRSKFYVTRFTSGEVFLKNYSNYSFDIVFMDIDLPRMNGMDVSKLLRKNDKKIVIVFVTSLAQYAVAGYEVNALDFIVKPFSYSHFKIKMRRVLNRLKSRREIRFWINVTGSGKKALNSGDLKYVEVMKHNVIYHTLEGDFNTTGTMIKAQELLKNAPFCLCNRCYLVNLKYVTEVKNFQVKVGDDILQISHLKRGEFIDKLNEFIAGGLDDD